MARPDGAEMRDPSHINPGPPCIVFPSTSRGDTNMRKFIFIAGFVLVSAAAHAGDRSLSLGGVETKAAPAPARASDSSKSAEAPQAAEAPRYVERPAVAAPKAETPRVETSTAETPAAETSRAETGRNATARSRASRTQAARMQRATAGRASAGSGRAAMAQRQAMMSRGGRPHSIRYGIKMRIISALHRHGIYW
jgi:hypothetical protein